ncbi:MAG TPA: hypothetical protein VEI80_00875 [Candidatus Acidoferrales bacterium]|nr:hypothetical protein [Candidatus Acidoferrales bacterium]
MYGKHMNITPDAPSSTAQQHSTQFRTALLRGPAMAAADESALLYHRTSWYEACYVLEGQASGAIAGVTWPSSNFVRENSRDKKARHPEYS